MSRAEPAATLVFVGLGANLGDPMATLAAALQALAALPCTALLASSSIYRSAPVDAQGPDFYNAVAELRTGLTAAELLRHLQAIEQAHGRLRPYPNAPRTLDLDLLLYADALLAEPGLTVPHPRMHSRAFVLEPLAELAPAIQIPGHGAIGPLRAAAAGQAIERLAPV